MDAPVLPRRIQAPDGSWLELWGDWSIRQLTLVVQVPVDCGCDCGGCSCGDGGELELDRDQVVELRDQLTAWLERGQP